jgi:hypothetical protein
MAIGIWCAGRYRLYKESISWWDVVPTVAYVGLIASIATRTVLVLGFRWPRNKGAGISSAPGAVGCT